MVERCKERKVEGEWQRYVKKGRWRENGRQL